MVNPYPIPRYEQVSDYYSATVDGQPLHVSPVRVSAMAVDQIYRGRQRPIEETELAGMVLFEGEGPATMEVFVECDIFCACVVPASKGVKMDIERGKGARMRFTLPEPGSYVLELNGVHKPLHIFYNPPEVDAPTPDAEGVIYFAPGLHNAGTIQLHSNQTLYIAGGARVLGCVELDGAENVRICGRGIIDARDISRRAAHNAIRVTNSKNVRIEDVVLHDAPCFSLTVGGSEYMDIDNVKIIGQWRYNSDGVDLHNSHHINIRRCFVRTFDDNIVLKGVHQVAGVSTNHAPMHDILSEDCVLWNDWGRALEIGAETVAEAMYDIVFRRCEVLHFLFIACDVQACGDAHVHDVLFEDINIGEPLDPQCDPRLTEIFIRPMCWIKGDKMGRVSNITFRNIRYTGRTSAPNRFIGYRADSDIQGVHLENVTVNGEKLTPKGHPMSKILYNDFASGIDVDGVAMDAQSAVYESEQDTCNSFLIGNGAFIVM